MSAPIRRPGGAWRSNRDKQVVQCPVSRPAWTLAPYLFWAVAWYAFFLFCLNVRVPSPLWEPVYLWVFAQVSLLEPATGDLGRREALGIMLAVYFILGCVLWVTLEARSRPRAQGIWKRSGLAWAGLVVLSILVAFALLKWR